MLTLLATFAFAAHAIVAPAPAAPVAQRAAVQVQAPTMVTTCYLNANGTCWGN